MRAHSAAIAAILLMSLASPACVNAGVPVLATNNAEGRYEEGVFRLPPLVNPLDKYTLELTIGDKPKIVINLPAGATGLVFGANAAPTGTWSWTYALQRAELPSMPVFTAENLVVSGGILIAYQGKLLLEWDKVPNATSYRIALATWEEAKGAKKADWGEDKKLTADCAEPELTKCHLDFDAAPGKQYRWSVTAIDKSKIDIARSAPRTIKTADSTLASIKKSGWSLQRSDSGSEDDKKAALFSYARLQDPDTPRTSSYSAALAVVWQPAAGFSDLLFPRASIETRRTSSGKDKEDDSTTVRAGVYGTSTKREEGKDREGFNWTASAKYEEARKEGARKGTVEFRVTPFLKGLGKYHDFPAVGDDGRNSAGNTLPDHFPIMQVMPLLTLSAEVGKTFEVGSSAETQDTIKRLRADLRFDMLWPRLSNGLGVLSVSSYGGGSYWRLPGQGDEHHLAQAGISIGLTSEISLEIAYKVGEEAPNFKFARSTNVGVGFKF